MADIKKKIDIEVNSSQAEKKILNLLKQIKTISDNTNKTFSNYLKAQKESLDVLTKTAKAEKDITESKKIQLSLEERMERVKKEAALSRELKELETPKMSAFRYAQKYKGVGGAFQRMSDVISEKGEIKAEESAANIKAEELKYQDIAEQYGEGSNEAKAQQSKIDELKKARSKEIGEYKTRANKYADLGKVISKVSASLEKLGKAVLNIVTKPFKDLYEGVKKVVQSMISLESGVATYATNTSLITNTAAREQQMRYGLTSSQNYAFSRAKEMLNIQSDEDLMYMNVDQRERFLSYMERYSQWYDQMEASGILNQIQEMGLEFKELKEELAMEFLQWVAANKETIMNAIRGIFEFIKIIAKVVVDIINFITRMVGGKGSYGLSEIDSTSDQINNTNNSRQTNITINANTTNNATGVLGSQEAMTQWSEENWANLAKQVVGVIGG